MSLLKKIIYRKKIPALLDIIRDFADVEYEHNRKIKEEFNPDKEALEKKREKFKQKLDLIFPSDDIRLEHLDTSIRFGGLSTLLNPNFIKLLESNGIFFQYSPTRDKLTSMILGKIVRQGETINIFNQGYKWYAIETETPDFKGIDIYENTRLPKESRNSTFYLNKGIFFSESETCIINLTNMREYYSHLFDFIQDPTNIEGNIKLFYQYGCHNLEKPETMTLNIEERKQGFVDECMRMGEYNLFHIRTGAQIELSEYKEGNLYAHLLTIKECKPDTYVYAVLAEMYKNGLIPHEVFEVADLDKLLDISPEKFKEEATRKFEEGWCSIHRTKNIYN